MMCVSLNASKSIFCYKEVVIFFLLDLIFFVLFSDLVIIQKLQMKAQVLQFCLFRILVFCIETPQCNVP